MSRFLEQKQKRQSRVPQFCQNVMSKIGIKQRRGKESYSEDLGSGVQLEVVAIPEGTFTMGSPKDEVGSCYDEKPQHEVHISSFYMGRYPVTQAQWEVIVLTPKIDIDLKQYPSRFRGSDLPVERVSFYEAVEFCKRLSRETGRNYRLPSEAEWEYACRAGTTTPFHFGETITGELANYRATDEPKGEYREETTPVGYFKATNAFGLYDMHGNVYEWCEDDYHFSYDGAPTDGSAWISKEMYTTKILRGGSWGSSPLNCRSACRHDIYPRDSYYDYVGFRVVRSSPRTS